MPNFVFAHTNCVPLKYEWCKICIKLCLYPFVTVNDVYENIPNWRHFVAYLSNAQIKLHRHNLLENIDENIYTKNVYIFILISSQLIIQLSKLETYIQWAEEVLKNKPMFTHPDRLTTTSWLRITWKSQTKFCT